MLISLNSDNTCLRFIQITYLYQGSRTSERLLCRPIRPLIRRDLLWPSTRYEFSAFVYLHRNHAQYFTNNINIISLGECSAVGGIRWGRRGMEIADPIITRAATWACEHVMLDTQSCYTHFLTFNFNIIL